MGCHRLIECHTCNGVSSVLIHSQKGLIKSNRVILSHSPHRKIHISKTRVQVSKKGGYLGVHRGGVIGMPQNIQDNNVFAPADQDYPKRPAFRLIHSFLKISSTSRMSKYVTKHAVTTSFQDHHPKKPALSMLAEPLQDRWQLPQDKPWPAGLVLIVPVPNHVMCRGGYDNGQQTLAV